jgi:hypothetical protein
VRVSGWRVPSPECKLMNVVEIAVVSESLSIGG